MLNSKVPLAMRIGCIIIAVETTILILSHVENKWLAFSLLFILFITQVYAFSAIDRIAKAPGAHPATGDKPQH